MTISCHIVKSLDSPQYPVSLEVKRPDISQLGFGAFLSLEKDYILYNPFPGASKVEGRGLMEA